MKSGLAVSVSALVLAAASGQAFGAGPPQAHPVSPGTGTGTSQVFTFTYSDPDGYQNLAVVNILMNNFLDGRNACYLAYSRPDNVLYLVADDGGTLMPGLVLNGSGTRSNSQCTVNGTASSATGAGNTLTLTLSLSFTPAFAGNRVMYLAARDLLDGNSAWQALGAWNVAGAGPTGPAVSGVSPARSSGSGAQVYTFTYTDTFGFEDLGVVNVLINDALDGRQACYLGYSRAANVLFLLNDTGTALLPGLVLNGSGSTANSQCTISGAGSSASGSGNTFTLILNITFSSTFAGNRLIYMAARSNGDLLSSGWQAAGSRSVTASVGCTFALSSTIQAVPPVSSGTTLEVIASAPTCGWTAVSSVDWVVITSGPGGAGNGVVAYSVAASNIASERLGVLTIAGIIYTVIQGPSATNQSEHDVELKVDGGTILAAVGAADGSTSAWFVNRLRPPAYPAVLKRIEIYFGNRSNGLAPGAPITLVATTDPSGFANFDGQVFYKIPGLVNGLGAFNRYPMPSATINSGDFIVGFAVPHVKGVFPADFDNTSPSAQRSYASTNGGATFFLMDSQPGQAGNFAIRAFVAVPGAGGGNPSGTPIISVQPASLAFGTVAVGQNKDLTVVVSNPGNATLNVSSLNIASPFSVVSPAVPFTVAAGSNANVTVRFTPTNTQAQAGNLTVASNAPAQPSVSLPLTGTGTAVDNTGLLAYWNFDDGSGTVANDVSGNGNSGTLMNGPTWVAGIKGGALSFDGVNDYVTIGTKLKITSANFTVEAWIRGDPTMDAFGRIVDCGYSSGFALGGGIDRRQVLFEFRNSPYLASTILAIDNTWHHVVVVKNAGTASLYVDGILQGSVAVNPASPTNTLPIFIGFNPGEGQTGYWKGLIDEIRIFGRALTPTEVNESYKIVNPAAPIMTVTPSTLDFGSVTVNQNQNLTVTISNTGTAKLNITSLTAGGAFSVVSPAVPFTVESGANATVTVRFSPTAAGAQAGTLTIAGNDPSRPSVSVPLTGTGAPIPASGLLAWWKFDEGTGAVAGDASGNNNNGTILNGPAWVAGVKGTALNFDGVNDYVDIGTKLKITTVDFTAEAWIKGDPNMDGFGRILDSGYATGLALGSGFDRRQLLFEFRGSAYLSSTAFVVDNTWHHVAVVKSGGTATMYADGVLQGSANVNPGAPTNTLPLWIGYNPGEGTRGYWKGLIDEVKIYSRALTAAEVKASYDASKP